VLADRHAIRLDSDTVPDLAWVEGEGTVDSRTLLLDNQSHAGRQGLRVYCVLHLGPQAGDRLLDLGWLPMRADRTLPDAACPAGPMQVRGLLMSPPSSGLRLGAPMQSVSSSRWLMTRVEVDAIDHALGVHVPPRVVRLDPTLPVGYARDLDILPNTLPPERHLGYAVQWWALALAVFVTALVLTLRKPRA
jgi:cytochrome oxidase assembly protein ShyY1